MELGLSGAEAIALVDANLSSAAADGKPFERVPELVPASVPPQPPHYRLRPTVSEAAVIAGFGENPQDFDDEESLEASLRGSRAAAPRGNRARGKGIGSSQSVPGKDQGPAQSGHAERSRTATVARRCLAGRAAASSVDVARPADSICRALSQRCLRSPGARLRSSESVSAGVV